MEQEHERAAGAWHSEWLTLTDLLTTVGSAAAWLADCLGGLWVDAARMAHLVADSTDGALATALADAWEPTKGRAAAHDAAAEAAREAYVSGRPLSDVLIGRPDVDGAVLTAVAAPDAGEAGAQVDAVLAEHRRLTEGQA
jgi:3-carboxy-cis,cis-muconate cycloisomerase